VSDPLISVKIDSGLAREAFLRFPREFERIVDINLFQGAKEVANIARSLAPVALGPLHNAIDARKVGPLHYQVSAGGEEGKDGKINYADAVETGAPGPMKSQPGTTKGLEEWVGKVIGEKNPKKASRLAFVIARSMKTKGIRAQPYLAPAAERGRSQLTNLVKLGVAQAVTEIFG
jgi:hypothetical protein